MSPRRARCRHDPTDHQEKTIVIDDELAFVGGIDMTDLAGDRFDVSAHPARRCLGWHDVATQSRGPGVGDVAEHFAMRWREVTGERLAVFRRRSPVQHRPDRANSR